MPELPEVETVCRSLNARIVGQQIISIRFFTSALRIALPDKKSISSVCRRAVDKIERRGKYILCFMDSGLLIVIHLGMSGSIRIADTDKKTKHDHIVMRLDDGSFLIYNDPRRFGLMKIIPQKNWEKDILFDRMGVEPLSSSFNAAYLRGALSKKKQSIKSALMSQSVAAGIGNIYASEILFLSRVYPLTPSSLVDEDGLREIVRNAKIVLRSAIKSGGSTLKDYRNIQGEKGTFLERRGVYGREGEPCKICGTSIRKILTDNRSSFFCPRCQPIK